MSENKSIESERVDRFRHQFLKDRLRLVREYGIETFDQAQTLYICSKTGRQVVIRDAFTADTQAGSPSIFVQGLTTGWWAHRQTFKGDEADADLVPVAGLYARFLPQVGFDYLIEFNADGPSSAWRCDRRGQAQELKIPTDDGMFHDQTGTFLDVRAGWRWLVERHRTTGRIATAEVESGYVIGVRAGVPGDTNPADREDPELDEVFSTRFEPVFDTLEFLAGPIVDSYPFQGDRYPSWLGEASEAVDEGSLELFVLADSEAFRASIEDVCTQRQLSIHWVGTEDDPRAVVRRGLLFVELEMAYPFLHTIHGGHSFAAGAALHSVSALDLLEDAQRLLDKTTALLTDYTITIEGGMTMVIHAEGESVPVGRWNLAALAGRSQFEGEEGVQTFLRLIGYDAKSERFVPQKMELDTCPACGAPARVNKVIRPRSALGVDPRTLVGVPIGEHLVYYTLECALHTVPLQPEHDLGTLEAAYRQGLAGSVIQVLATEILPSGASLIIGFDVGSLVLEPARVKAVLESIGVEEGGTQLVYAFFPDGIVVAQKALKGQALRQARQRAAEVLRPHFGGRLISLGIVREVDLNVAPLGLVSR